MAMPVGTTGRMVRGKGVSAEGIRRARAASTWSRIAAAEGMAKELSPYIRLFRGGVQSEVHREWGKLGWM